MKEPPLLTLWEKRKAENEYTLSLVYKEQSTTKLIKTPNIDSLRRLLLLTSEPTEY